MVSNLKEHFQADFPPPHTHTPTFCWLNLVLSTDKNMSAEGEWEIKA